MEKKENKVSVPGNLHTDKSPALQPKGTSRFALNAVNESIEGDLGNLSVEEGNAPAHVLPVGFIPLGSVNIGDGNTAILLGNGEDSIIAVLDKNNNVEIFFDDRNQTEKLGFKISEQIDCTYRLRRGCERTLYFVDPKPRFFVLDRPEKFKKSDGTWNTESFSLFRKTNKIPKFSKIEVNSSGGSLPPGTYVISVQYLDYDFNPTEFYITSKEVRIFANNISESFRNIEGDSINDKAYYDGVENTSKSIGISIQDLDTDNFPFYRIAITEYNKGNGLISSVKYTSEIPTTNKNFTYTGSNFIEEGTSEEVSIFNMIIDEAQHIDQLDNMLILSETKGNQTELCNFQRFASKIQTDLSVKKVKLSIPEGANSKNPTSAIEGLGHMPGEIYSYGVVYIIDNNYFTPVYHIPGRSPEIGESTTFTEGDNIYPMSNDNQCKDIVYTDNNSCDSNGSGYWGLDSQGNVLKNKKIRHHRFPFRSDIGLPLVKDVSSDTESSTESWQIKISLSGNLDIPECPPEGEPGNENGECVDIPIEELDNILYEIEYKNTNSSGVPTGDSIFFAGEINYLNWDENAFAEGDPAIIDYTLSEFTNTGLSVVSLKEIVTKPDGSTLENPITLNGGEGSSSETGITYNLEPIPSEYSIEGAVYEANIMGLKFSNIEIPQPSQVGGKRVTGYFFVRNKREQSDKTVLDTGIIGQCLQSENNKYVAHSHLMPEIENEEVLDRTKHFLLFPEFKFNDFAPTNISKIVLQGDYIAEKRLKSRYIIEDIAGEPTYQKGKHKRSERDYDGWNLHVRTRNTKLNYISKPTQELLTDEDIEEIFYLGSLESKIVSNENEEQKEFINVVSDNKVGVISTIENLGYDLNNKLAFVSLMRENNNPYANFRSTSYIKTTDNYYNAGQPGDKEEREEFGGDTYISSVAHVNSLFVNNKQRRRRTKSGLGRLISGIAAIALGVAAVAITLLSGGTLTAVGVGLAGAAISIGATLLSSSISQKTFNRVYTELYDKGLRDTVKDSFVKLFDANPYDDEYQWVGDMADVFYESSVNCGLRVGVNKGTDPDFLNSPALFESGNASDSISEQTRPATELDRYTLQKLTFLDLEKENESGRNYIGFALPEIYDINDDYQVESTQKLFEHLPIEYDCCSDCLEDFPHRVHFSLQSFEEELTDNFSVFLPNNYKDMPGSTGKIVDTFVMRDKFFVITEHALWELPKRFQERITDDIVSFIGTGEYFSVPPRKIVDDSIDSAGTSFKWAVQKTKYGVLIISDKENKIYLFNGENLKPISNEGISNFFRENIKLKIEENYYKDNKEKYPYLDNVSNPIGAGYITTYDSQKDRFIITKKDTEISNLPVTDYKICQESSNETIIFEEISQTIAQKESEGYTFLGIENCQLKFEREVLEDVTKIVNESSLVGSSTNIVFWLDTSGSFTAQARQQIKQTIFDWQTQFRIEEGWEGNLYIAEDSGPESERWIHALHIINERSVVSKMDRDTGNMGTPSTFDTFDKDIILVSFVNESSGAAGFYHGNRVKDSNGIFIPEGSRFNGDSKRYKRFFYPESANVGNMIPKSLNCLLYPVVFEGSSGSETTRTFLAHSLLAIKSSSNNSNRSFTEQEFNSLEVNPAFTVGQWESLKMSLVYTDNPYLDGTSEFEIPGNLDQYGWTVFTSKFWDTNNPGEPIIKPAQLKEDLGTYLESVSVVEPVEITVQESVTETTFVPGTKFEPNKVDNSWTLSYSLKSGGWVSYHSYLPRFYLKETERFYSWISNQNKLWKHNIKGLYQNFYGKQEPFIIEFVSNTSPLTTDIWDSILYQAEAKVYDEISETFIDLKDRTFNKALFYNSYQTSGIKSLVFKDVNANYMLDQITDNSENIIVDRNERDFTLNNIRNYRKDRENSMFLKNNQDLQNDYFIDKIPNENNIDLFKNWSELESFRDKYLVVRLFFDTFDDTKLTMFFSVEDSKPSQK